MKQHLGHIALLVDDYDTAIAWFSEKLAFRLIEDTRLTDTKRWVVMSPPGAQETTLLLARAADAQQARAIGAQSGGRVFLFLFTDDFWRDYDRMKQAGVMFVRPPRDEPYGTVAVFQDLYGNLWDLLQPSTSNESYSIT